MTIIPYKEYPEVHTIFPEITPLFLENFLATEPIVVNQGGTSSSKTWNILKVDAQLLIDNDGWLCTVTGQDIPNLKDGSYNDFKDIVLSNDKLAWAIQQHNKSEREFTFKNGSRIQFKAYDDWQDAKNGKRHILFANEANGISYEIFEELQSRTKYKTFIDYNPNAEFWVHDKILNNDVMVEGVDYKFIKSTWRDNPFIPDNIRKKILGYKDTDPYRWQVYGLGELGLLEGCIFPDWQSCEDIPTQYDEVISGIDFGYFNTPTTLIDVYRNGRTLIFDEVIYQKDYLLKNLAERMKLYDSDHVFVADCAEPKMIAALRREGLGRVLPAVKGTDSIKLGINKLKEYECYYTKRSVNIAKEKANYIWDSKTGKPIDDFNHAIDAIRYANTAISFR